MKRSGVSVLISGVLMVIFAVVMASILAPWGEDLVEGLTLTGDDNVDSFEEGRNADLRVKEVELDKFYGYANMTVQNTGDVVLNSLRLDILCEDQDVVNENLGVTLSSGELANVDIQSNDIVGCHAESVEIQDTSIGGLRKDPVELEQETYYVMGIEDETGDFPGGSGFMFIDADADFDQIDGKIDDYGDLAKISPGGFVDQPLAGGDFVVHLDNGRFVSTDGSNMMYWDLKSLKSQNIDGNKFSVVDNFENLGFFTSPSRMDKLSSTEIVQYNSSSGNEKVQVVDLGRNVGGTSKKIVDSLNGKINVFSFPTVLKGRDILIYNESITKHMIWRAGDQGSEGSIISKGGSSPTPNGIMVEDYLIITRKALGSGNPGNVTIYDASDGLTNIFDEEPFNTFNGTNGSHVPLTLTRIQGDRLAYGTNNYAGKKEADTIVFNFKEDTIRSDAERIYESSDVQNIPGYTENNLFINTGIPNDKVYILDRSRDRKIGDGKIIDADGNKFSLSGSGGSTVY